MQPVPRRCASGSRNGEQGVAAEWGLPVEARFHLISGKRAISAACLACIVGRSFAQTIDFHRGRSL